MINLDSITNKKNKEHNEKWPYVPDHMYRMLKLVVVDQEKPMHCLT